MLLAVPPPEGAQPGEAAASAPAPVPLASALPGDAAVPPALIRRVEIVGSSLSAQAKARLRARFTGLPLTAANGERAAKAMQSAYKHADIMMAQVGGPGLGADGVLTLAALEGRIGDVQVEGGDSRLQRLARELVEPLLHEAPLSRSRFQRQTALVALLPGVRMGVGFEVTDQPGVMRLKIGLVSVPWRVDARVTNRGAASFGDWQGRADLHAFSLLTAGDQAVLTAGATPDMHQLRLIGATYGLPIGRDGLTAVLSMAHVDADPYRSGQASTGTSVLGALAYPIEVRWDRTFTVTGVADGQDGQNASGAVVLRDERTRNLRAALQYTRLFGTRTLIAGATATAGLPVLDARPAYAGYAPTRYAKLQAFGAGTLPYGQWTVRLHAAAQATDGRVPSTEQFTVGGDDYGRAFRAVSLQGDQGVAGALEVARRLRGGGGLLSGSEAYVYADAGAVNVEPRPGVAGGHGRLASVGAGVRIGLGPSVGLELSADHALDFHNPLGGPREGGWRIGVRLHLAYAPGVSLQRAADWARSVGDLRSAAPFTN